MAKKQDPQSLYSGTPLPRPTKKIVVKEPARPYAGYAKACKTFARLFGLGKNSKFSEEQRQAVEFLDIDVSPEDVYGAYKGFAYYGVALGIIAGLLTAYYTDALFSGEFLLPALAAVAVGGLGVAAGYFFLAYPLMQADRERKLAIAYVPEIVNYLVMNMRLNPNLERAVEFAANHGRGKIAEDFKKLVWDVQLGVYSSVEEGLDALAYRWGSYNDDFKHALMLVRASVLEGDEVRRDALLEKAGADVIEGSKEKMDLYARQLHQPTIYLYYFGILLPLMLAIVLPIASGFLQNLPITGLLPFLLVYDVILPIIVFAMAQGIISGRPPTYVPPDIPENFEGLPKKGMMRVGAISLPYAPLALAAFAAILFLGGFLDAQNIAAIKANPQFLEADKAVDALPHVTIPLLNYRLYQFSIFALLIAIGVSVSVYLRGKYSAAKAVQDDVRAMESEFKDALYVLASRLGENRPIEDALRHAIEFLPKSRVANKVFKRILDNITTLGMTIDNAIFDNTFGAVKDVPSETIRGGMRIMTDSVQLGVNVAASSLINLALQIRNQQKVDEMLRRLLEDVTTLLKTMGTFIAPIVLAVVTSLQRIIINSLTANCPEKTTEALASQSLQNSGIGGGGISQAFCNIDAAKTVSPGEFTLVMGIYVIEIVVLLTYFNSQVEDTNNKLHTYMSIAAALPVAVIVFSLVSYIATSFLAPTG